MKFNLFPTDTFLGTLGDEILDEINREKALRGDGLRKRSRKRQTTHGSKGKKKGSANKKRRFH